MHSGSSKLPATKGLPTKAYRPRLPGCQTSAWQGFHNKGRFCLRHFLCLARPLLAPDVGGITAPYRCNAADQASHHCADQANAEVTYIKGQTTSNGTDGVSNLHSSQKLIS